MARTSKSRGVEPFKMRTGNSPLYKMMGSSPVKQDYDWKSTGNTPENVILPEDDNIIIDVSKTEKVKPQEIKRTDIGETTSTSSRPEGGFVTEKPTPDAKETKTAKSSGMSSDDFKAIGGAAMEAIGDIGRQMSEEAQKEMETESFTNIRSAFNKKSLYKKGLGSRGYKINKNN
jgi:hypothetical protein